MRRPHWMASLALAFALMSGAVIGLALFGFKYGWLKWGTAAFLLYRAPQPLALVAVALGLVAVLMAAISRLRVGFMTALAAVVLGALVYMAMSMQQAERAKYPPVHDVATSWTDPPMPSAALAAQRGADANPVEAAPTVPAGAAVDAGHPVGEVNARTCPAAVPITLMQPTDKAYALALKAVSGRGLHLVTTDAPHGVIEGVSTNFWNMKEDLMVRVRPDGAGSRIDLRSISRQGQVDHGHNCRRITQIRAALTPN